MIIALLSVKTVNLVEWAVVFKGKAKQDSAYMRIRRFFRSFDINLDVIASLLFSWFGLEGKQIYLTLDRTNWKLGNWNINILMLGVVYEGIAIPLFWSLLSKRGNSNYKERVSIISRFVNLFGSDCIAGLLGDRKFVGKHWFKYLERQNIPYYIRIKQNMLISNSKGVMKNAMFLFSGLKRCEKRVLSKKRKISGLELFIAGVRCPDGSYLIVATTEPPDDAIDIYAKRWQIETLFGCLKSRGFNFEDTHLTDPERLTKLIVIMSIGFAWAHKMGQWHNHIKPIKIKKHGRKAESIFHYGLRVLRRIILSNPGVRLCRQIFKLLETPPDQIHNIKLAVTL